MGLLVILLPILLADIVNPVLLAGIVYGLGTQHPFVNAWMITLSFFCSYLLAGVVTAIGIEQITSHLEVTVAFDYALEFIVALLLFYFSWKMFSSDDPHLEEELTHSRKMRRMEAINLGLQINIVGLPFALPYLAAIDQILKANLTPLYGFLYLLIYNVLYILPFTVLIFIRWYYRSASEPIFERINLCVHRFSQRYLPYLFLFLGLLLIEDYVSYFLGYREYSFLSLT